MLKKRNKSYNSCREKSTAFKLANFIDGIQIAFVLLLFMSMLDSLGVFAKRDSFIMNCTVIDKNFEIDSQYGGRVPKYNVIVQDNATGSKYTIDNEDIFNSTDKEVTIEVTKKYNSAGKIVDTIFKEVEEK